MCFKKETPTFLWEVLDVDGDPVDIDGKEFLLVCHKSGRVSPVEVFRVTNPDFGVYGAHDNKIQATLTAYHTDTPGSYRYTLWNVTDDVALFAGRLEIMDAPQRLYSSSSSVSSSSTSATSGSESSSSSISGSSSSSSASSSASTLSSNSSNSSSSSSLADVSYPWASYRAQRRNLIFVRNSSQEIYWSIHSATQLPINVTGQSFRLVAYRWGYPHTPLFSVEASDIEVGGLNGEKVILTLPTALTAQPRSLRYVLWSLTKTVVLAYGTLEVVEALQ